MSATEAVAQFMIDYCTFVVAVTVGAKSKAIRVFVHPDNVGDIGFLPTVYHGYDVNYGVVFPATAPCDND